jgi:hypothetical protein
VRPPSSPEGLRRTRCSRAGSARTGVGTRIEPPRSSIWYELSRRPLVPTIDPLSGTGWTDRQLVGKHLVLGRGARDRQAVLLRAPGPVHDVALGLHCCREATREFSGGASSASSQKARPTAANGADRLEIVGRELEAVASRVRVPRPRERRRLRLTPLLDSGRVWQGIDVEFSAGTVPVTGTESTHRLDSARASV